MKITVLGTGTWGSALTQVLVDNNHNVIMYGISEDEVNDINCNHKNSKFFKDHLLPINMKATTDLNVALQDSSCIIVAVPTFAVRDVLNKIKPVVEKFKQKPYIVSVAKGFDPLTNKRMTEVIREVLGEDIIRPVVSLIGPGHAEEVILRLLTCITATSLDKDCAQTIQKIFSNEYSRVYTQIDEIGAEYGVALKNVIAIASGMCEGIGLGDNARAALVTRGLAEIVRFGMFFGGEMETYLGLTGLGDLMVTCNSHHSRNFMAGYEIGKVNSAKQFIENNTKTVEGIKTAKVVYDLSKQYNIDMPIVEAVYKVLYEGNKPKDIVIDLMKRKLKSE